MRFGSSLMYELGRSNPFIDARLVFTLTQLRFSITMFGFAAAHFTHLSSLLVFHWTGLFSVARFDFFERRQALMSPVFD